MKKPEAITCSLVMVIMLGAFSAHGAAKPFRIPCASVSRADLRQIPDSSAPGFLVISDIHLHAADRQSPEVTGNSDSGMDLWDSAQTKIRSVLSGKAGVPKPGFILYLGDLPWHTKKAAQVPDAMDNAGKALGDLRVLAERAHIPLLFVPGNNDSPWGDYGPFSDSLFQHDPGGNAAWPVIDGVMSDTTEWGLGCYSAFPLHTGSSGLERVGDLRVVVMNTNIFTARYGRVAGRERQTAESGRELAWLAGQLVEAGSRQQAVLIALHVPPGKDGYLPADSNRSICAGNFKDLWDPNVHIQLNGNSLTPQNAFLDLVDTYKRSIVGIVGSHTHMDGIRMLGNRAGDSISTVLISAPGITPGHGNNPGIKLISYDPANFQLTGFTTFYNDFFADRSVRAWGDSTFRFREVFHTSGKGSMQDQLKGISPADLEQDVNGIYTVRNGNGYANGNCVQVTLYVHYQP